MVDMKEFQLIKIPKGKRIVGIDQFKDMAFVLFGKAQRNKNAKNKTKKTK